MKNYLINALFVLGISLFCGFVVISIGIGSVFTPLNQIARPVVCGSQRLLVEQHTYSYRPGEKTWTINAYCVDDQTGAKKDRTLLVQLVSGAIYGLGVFSIAILLLGWGVIKRLLTGQPAGASSPAVSRRGASDFLRPDSGEQPSFTSPARDEPPSEDVEERLAKLKRLYDAGLITGEDYEKKKTELLEEL